MPTVEELLMDIVQRLTRVEEHSRFSKEHIETMNDEMGSLRDRMLNIESLFQELSGRFILRIKKPSLKQCSAIIAGLGTVIIIVKSIFDFLSGI